MADGTGVAPPDPENWRKRKAHTHPPSETVCFCDQPWPNTNAVPVADPEGEGQETDERSASGSALLREALDALESIWHYTEIDAGEHHQRWGEACGTDACVVCLIHATAVEVLNKAEAQAEALTRTPSDHPQETDSTSVSGRGNAND